MQEQRLLQRTRGLLPTDWNAMVYIDHALPPMVPWRIPLMYEFGSTSVVVGVHGAGLSHLIFCQSSTQVVEIALPEPHALYFQHLSAELGLSYSEIPMRGSGLCGAPVLQPKLSTKTLRSVRLLQQWLLSMQRVKCQVF